MAKFNNIKNIINPKNEKNAKDRLKRNKSLIGNKKQKIRTNGKKLNEMNMAKKEGYFTSPTLKSNIQLKIEGNNLCNKGKYSNIGVRSITEAVINTFFVNQKNKLFIPWVMNSLNLANKKYKEYIIENF